MRHDFLSSIFMVHVYISCRWGVKMPEIVTQSIMILASGGLGMATFSLGMKRHQQFRAMTLWTKTLDEHEFDLVTFFVFA